MKKKKAKMSDNSKPNDFDIFLIDQKNKGVFKKN